MIAGQALKSKTTIDAVLQTEEANARHVRFPMKLVVDLSPDAILEIIVGRTADDAQLARQLIESLRTTKERECYFPTLERKFRFESGER